MSPLHATTARRQRHRFPLRANTAAVSRHSLGGTPQISKRSRSPIVDSLLKLHTFAHQRTRIVNPDEACNREYLLHNALLSTQVASCQFKPPPVNDLRYRCAGGVFWVSGRARGAIP